MLNLGLIFATVFSTYIFGTCLIRFSKELRVPLPVSLLLSFVISFSLWGLCFGIKF